MEGDATRATSAYDKWIEERFSSIEARFNEYRSAQQISAQTAVEAIRRAETAMDKRFESVNEFRAQLTDQTRTFLTKSEYYAAHTPVVEKIEKLSQPQWSLLISLLTAAVVSIGGFWTVLGLKIETAVSPITVMTERNAATMTEQSKRIDRIANKVFSLSPLPSDDK